VNPTRRGGELPDGDDRSVSSTDAAPLGVGADLSPGAH
jgi:hypothetical protein